MGREEAYIPGIFTAIVFAVLGTTGYYLMPNSHEITWLILFVCAFTAFFGSIKTPKRETD